MIYGWLITGLAVLAPLPEDAISVSVRIEAEELKVGEEYEAVLTFEFKDGWSGAGAGISAPILQIEVPKGIELTGRVLTEYADLAKNEFLQAPFERLLKESPAKIGFKVVKPPSEDTAFGLSLLAYAGSSSGDDAWFLRRRLTLPVAPGATATPVAAESSDWGVEKVLQIGDRATPFTLPRADGSKVSLGKLRGKKNVIVTTYRAHW